jgi:hypothetical protein
MNRQIDMMITCTSRSDVSKWCENGRREAIIKEPQSKVMEEYRTYWVQYTKPSNLRLQRFRQHTPNRIHSEHRTSNV